MTRRQRRFVAILWLACIVAAILIIITNGI